MARRQPWGNSIPIRATTRAELLRDLDTAQAGTGVELVRDGEIIRASHQHALLAARVEIARPVTDRDGNLVMPGALLDGLLYQLRLRQEPRRDTVRDRLQAAGRLDARAARAVFKFAGE